MSSDHVRAHEDPGEWSQTRIVFKLDDIAAANMYATPDYNAAPSEQLPFVRRNPKTVKRSLDF
jgi:hypothetical protein